MAVDPLGLWIFLGGIALLVAELWQPGYFIGVAGTTGIIVGLVQIATEGAFLQSWWSPFVAVIVAGVSVWVSIEFYRRFAPAVKPPETLSSDKLVGQRARVTVPIEPHSLNGKVELGGIVWSATSDRAIPAGDWVVVTKVDGVHLVVEPASLSATESQKVGAPLGS